MGNIFQILSILLLVLTGYGTSLAQEDHSETRPPAPERARAYTARVGIMEDGELVLREVALPAFSRGWFRSQSMYFSELPDNLTPDANGCFCFSPPDPRFQFVHVYYHLNRQLAYFNELLTEAGERKLRDVEVRMKAVEAGKMPEGIADATAVDIIYGTEPVDPTALAHELGHGVHLRVLGQLEGFEPPGFNRSGMTLIHEYFGVLEGTANLLAAFYHRDPVVARFWWKDQPIRVNRREFYGTLPTLANRLRGFVDSESFAKAYPESVREFRRELERPEGLRYPDPYHASAVFSAPLWEASRRFDQRSVELTLIRALHATGDVLSYPEFASALVKVARPPELKSYLRREYQARGLLETKEGQPREPLTGKTDK